MLEIKFDPSTLTKAQREDLASFILGFESTEKLPLSGIFGESKSEDTSPYPDGVMVMPPQSKDDFKKQFESTHYIEGSKVGIDPNEIFGAPSSAGADPSSTAPVATMATTSTQPLIAPPPPAPLTATPVGTAAPQSLNPVDVDKNGMRWDARIHSSSKAKIADGTWKYRRGVTDDEIKKVEAELTGNVATPSQEQYAPPPLVQPGPSIAQLVDPTVDPVVLRQQFAQLMLKVAKSKGEGKLTAEEVTAVLQPYGVASLPLLANKLEVVPQVTAAIDAILASKG